MGSSQAAGRAIVGYLSPPGRLAEFFGLWGLRVKPASIFGPLTYGAVTWMFEGNHRLGILAVGAVFRHRPRAARGNRRRARPACRAAGPVRYTFAGIQP
jgi:UMF1 family MFS transporter